MRRSLRRVPVVVGTYAAVPALAALAAWSLALLDNPVLDAASSGMLAFSDLLAFLVFFFLLFGLATWFLYFRRRRRPSVTGRSRP